MLIGSRTIHPWQYSRWPTWSVLRQLGSSPVFRLTAIAPIIGGLVLLNDEVARLVHSTLLDGRWAPDQQKVAQATLGFIPVSRLNLTYLGLCVLGLGSLLFTMRCPPEIKQYGSPREWVDGEGGTLNEATLNLLLMELISDFCFFLKIPPDADGGTDDEVQLIDELKEMPKDLDVSWYKRFEILAIRLILNGQAKNPAKTPTFKKRFLDEQGIVRPREVFACLMWRRQCDIALTGAMFTQPEPLAVDIVITSYVHLNRIRYRSRVVCASLFALGFGLLTLPTLHTIGVILSFVPVR